MSRSVRGKLGAMAMLVALVTCWSVSPAAAQQTDGPDYVDDRSTPEAVLGSMYNAINRHEYARAWSYWESGPPGLSFDDFQNGYADTTLVRLFTGETGNGVGAGQLYYSTQVTLISTMSDGSTQTFVGCYVLHLARPSFQTNPPYQPMGIQRATIQQVANDADTAALMAAACPPV